MLRLDQFSSHQAFVMIYIFSVLIRNSSEILINLSQDATKINFILSLLQFSSTMRSIIQILNVVILIYGLYKIFITKKPTSIFQLMITILCPIHIWLSSTNLNQQQSTSQLVDTNLWHIINITLGSLILITLPQLINSRFNFYHLKVNNHISSIYQTLLSIDFIVQVVAGHVGLEVEVIVWCVGIVKVVRSVVYFTRVNYQDVMVEYCALLGELTSWIGFVSMFLNIFYSINTTTLVWVSSAFMIYFTINKNPLLISILQYKYHRVLESIKQTLIEQISIGQNNSTIIQQQKLMQMIVMFNWIIKHQQNYDQNKNNNNKHSVVNQQNSQQWLIVRYSPRLLSEALHLVELFNFLSTMQQTNPQQQQSQLFNIDLTQNTINYQQINTNNKNNTNMLLSKHFQQNNSNNSQINNDQLIKQKWQMLWKFLQTIKQLQHQQYDEVRNLIIYSFPLYNIQSINKLMYFYYLNVMQSQTNKSSFSKIQLQIIYKYLTQRVFLQYQLKIKRQNCFQTDNKDKKCYYQGLEQQSKKKCFRIIDGDQHQSCQRKQGDCLVDTQDQLQTSKFDLFYRQSLIENQVQQYFTNIFMLSQKISHLTTQTKNKSQILNLLLQKNTLRQNIKQKIQSIQQLSLFKSIIYKYLFQQYINNTPYIAINNLKQRHFQQFLLEKTKKENNFMKKIITSKTINTYNNLKYIGQNNNQMVLFVSGMLKFGKIVNYCSNFKQIMQLNKAFSKHKIDNIENLSIYDIMLPIWINKHSKASKQSKKYAIPSHNDKNLYILSLASKKVFQISFDLHFIVRNMQDLIFSLEIKYKQVQKLIVYKKNMMVFESFTNRHQKQQARKRKLKLMKKRRRSFIGKLQVSDSDLSKYIMCTQTYFDQYYTFYKRYKSNKLGRQFRDVQVSSLNNKMIIKNNNKNIRSQQQQQEKRSINKQSLNQQQLLSLQYRLKDGNRRNINKNKSTKLLPQQKRHQFNPQSLQIQQQQSQEQQQQQHNNIKNKHSPPSTNQQSTIQLLSQQSTTTKHHQSPTTHSTKLLQQIKLKQFTNKKLFLKQKLQLFTFIHWQIPPIIFFISFLIRWYSIQQKQNATNNYQIKLILENDFMITDTQLLMSLAYVDQLGRNGVEDGGYLFRTTNMTNYNNSNKMMNNDNNNNSISQIIQLALQDINNNIDTINIRQQLLFNKITTSSNFVNIIFNPINSLQNPNIINSITQHINNRKSFYYTTLQFEIMAEQYLDLIGYKQISTYNEQINISSINKQSTHNPDFQRFFNKFKHRYQHYINPNNINALFTQIQYYQTDINNFSKTFLTYFMIAVAGVAFSTAILFVIVYVDLQYSIQKMVLGAIHFPSGQFKKVIEKIHQGKQMLQNAKQHMPSKIVSTYHHTHYQHQYHHHHQSNEQQQQKTNKIIQKVFIKNKNNQLINNQNINNQRQSFINNIKKSYNTRCQIFKLYIVPIFIFIIIVVLCQFLLISFISSVIRQVQLIDNFSHGTQQLAQIAAMSNQISIEMTFSISQTNKDMKFVFQQKVQHYQEIDKLNMLKQIQLTQQQYLNHTFSPVCSLFQQMSIPSQCINSKKQSYYQLITSNLKLYKTIQNHLIPQQQSSSYHLFNQLNIHLQKIHQQLSLLNIFIKEMIHISQHNYQFVTQDPTKYLDFLIIEMIIIIILFNWYTVERLYFKMRCLYVEMFSACDVGEMSRMEKYNYFFNQAKHYKTLYISGQFVQ